MSIASDGGNCDIGYHCAVWGIIMCGSIPGSRFARKTGSGQLSTSRLLIAVSSPWASEKFAGPVADLASRLEAEAIVAHVASPNAEDESENEARERGEQTLKILSDSLNEAGINNECVMLFSDDIAKAIINTAKARECTLIVVGLTAKGILKRLIDGDVSTNIARQSEIPLLLCPADWGGKV